MAINFPDSPTNGQVATIGGKNYTYNSTKNTWTPTQVTEADLSSVGSTTVVATHDLLPSSPSAGDMALVSSVNKMYVYFLSGWWLMSSLQNASPSGITGNAAIYDLATDGTPTTVTLSSSDPEGFPISWSHSVISGSLGGTTVTNVDNVFTITPSTDAADAGTFTLRFAASDGQGGESGSQSQFTLDFVFIVVNSNYTTLLATAVDTSDNNNITDASSNNHNITVNGDAHAGTFSPYRSGGYSGLFDSTNGVKLSFAGSSDFEFGTGNFTIEMWFKWNSSSKPETTIFSNRITGSTFSEGRFFLKLMPGDLTSGGIEFAFDCGAPRYRMYCVDNLTADDAFFNEGWHHYAAVRNGTSLKLFVDGQEVDEITLPANETNFGNSSDNIGLGVNHNVSSPSGPDGEYRDVRIVKGVAIIPPSGGPTEPLGAVSGTTLLLYNGEGYPKDKSTSNHSPIYGSTVPTITATGPYDHNEYAATDHGGSVYFDGTGDTLEIPHNTNVGAFGTSDFTVQIWYYTEAIGSQDYLIDFRQYGANGDYLSIFKNGSNKIVVAEGGSNRITGTKDISVGQWFFITVHRDSGSLKLFVNGEQDGSTYSDSTNYVAGSSGNFIIGKNNGSAGYSMQGYLSDIRVTHGSALDGTTVPTAPLSSTGSELHIKGTDASIIDKSQGTNLTLFGNTTGSTTQVKFAGSKSMYFDGSGDGILCKGTQIPTGATESWTIEAWVYVTDTSTERQIFAQYSAGSSSTRFVFGVESSKFRVFNGGTSLYSLNAVSLNTWTHVAVTYNGSAAQLYVDGISQGTLTLNRGVDDVDLQIGARNQGATQPWVGYIQDARVTKGLARYTANFTPPSAPLEG